MTDPLFVSVKEAARLVGLSTYSLYKLCDQQVIETRYQGSRRLVVFASLKEYADSLPRFPESA